MSSSTVKNRTVSTRVTDELSRRAKANLAKQGLTVSEYMRLSLIKAANNEVRFVDFLDTPEALQAKHEADTGDVKVIGDLKDFDHYMDHLDGD